MNKWILGSLIAVSPLMANEWDLTGEYVLYRRALLHNDPIVDDSNKVSSPCENCPNEHVMWSKHLSHFDYESGYRVGASYQWNPRWLVEGSFLWVGEWSSSHHRQGDQSLSFPFYNDDYTHDFREASWAHATYESQFYNAEINCWRIVTPRKANYFSFSQLFGLRYINLNEEFHIAFTRGANKSDYNIHAKNRMGGVQVGANLQLNPVRNLSWDATAKVGLLCDWGEQKTFLGDYDNTVKLRNHNADGHEAVLVADAAITLTYQWWKYLDTHVGYQIIYLSGLVLAPEQIDRHSGSGAGHHVYGSAQLLVHGLSAGLTFHF